MGPSNQSPDAELGTRDRIASGWAAMAAQGRWGMRALALILTFGLLLAFLFWLRDDGEAFARWVDPAITVVTLLVACLVYLAERYRAWLANLPRRLDAHVRWVSVEGASHVIMSVHQAPLSSESDIRAYGQQLTTMAAIPGQGRADLLPYFGTSRLGVRREQGSGPYFVLHSVTIFVRSGDRTRVWPTPDKGGSSERYLGLPGWGLVDLPTGAVGDVPAAWLVYDRLDGDRAGHDTYLIERGCVTEPARPDSLSQTSPGWFDVVRSGSGHQEKCRCIHRCLDVSGWQPASGSSSPGAPDHTIM